jgi:predicted choloylglycine hydrolase
LNTSSFINGEEGINEHGLVVAMTYVLPKLDEIKPGLNSVFLVRYLLENINTVQEGIQAVRNLPIASSCNLLLVDSSGSMVVMECNPLKINIRTPEQSEHYEDFIITVNHFSSPSMWEHDASNRNVYFSNDRYHTVFNALNIGDFGDLITHTQAILKGECGFMCQYGKALNFETIWSSLFDIYHRRIYRAEGDPRTTKFKEDRRLFA